MHIVSLNNWISELPPDVQNELYSRMSVREIRAGETVRSAGDLALSICHVQSGYIKLLADLPNGDEALVVFYVPGNTFGETAVICDRKLFHTTVAVTDAVLNVISKSDFDKCYAAYSEIPEALCRKFANALSSTVYFREVKAQYPISQQVAIVMLNLAECSSTPRIGDSKEIDIPITIAEISAFLGVTRQTVQKEITRLKNARIISKTLRRWTVVNIGRLEQEIDALKIRPI